MFAVGTDLKPLDARHDRHQHRRRRGRHDRIGKVHHGANRAEITSDTIWQLCRHCRIVRKRFRYQDGQTSGKCERRPRAEILQVDVDKGERKLGHERKKCAPRPKSLV